MLIKHSATYEVMFAIGSREGYHGQSFTKEQVMDAIGKFQETCPVAQPVKVTDKVTFVMKDYREDGWDISAICYPNHPPDRPMNQPGQVKEFMVGLAEHLFNHFKQNRITVRCLCDEGIRLPGAKPETFMFERSDAEKSHKK